MTGDRGAQIIILPEECESLCSALRQIRSVPVDASRVLLQDLKVKTQVVKEVSASRWQQKSMMHCAYESQASICHSNL